MKLITPQVETHGRTNVVRALLLGTAVVLLGAALLYNEFTLSPLAREEFTQLTREKIRGVQLGFAVTGLLLIGASEAVRRSGPLSRRLSGRAPEVALFVLVGLLPVALVDFGLRPFVVAKTSLFIEDDELGWRMKPNTEADWGDVRVVTNSQGLRGPEVPFAKPPGVLRVLFLGDSVTFGYGIAQTADIFPSRAGRDLASRLNAAVEIVNAGTGGYSPWQERIYLVRDGLRYAPDLLVIGFVLNDVAEKLTLVRFGGNQQAWQLAQSARNAVDRWLSASALATSMREGVAMLRFGSDVQLGASKQEESDVKQVTTNPAMERTIERAWRVTLENLAGIIDTATAEGIPSLIVLFPFSFQLAAPLDTAEPQRRVREFAAERGTPVLDLLPLFLEQDDPQRLMLDAAHLSAEGHAFTATAIVETVLERNLLAHGAPRSGRVETERAKH